MAATPVKKPNQKLKKRKKAKEGENKDELENEVSVLLPLTKRKPQTCSYCSVQGHVNRVLRGKIT